MQHPSAAARAPFKPVPKKPCASQAIKGGELEDLVEDMLSGVEDLCALAESIAAKLGIDLTEDGASGDTDEDTDEEDSDEQ